MVSEYGGGSGDGTFLRGCHAYSSSSVCIILLHLPEVSKLTRSPINFLATELQTLPRMNCIVYTNSKWSFGQVKFTFFSTQTELTFLQLRWPQSCSPYPPYGDWLMRSVGIPCFKRGILCLSEHLRKQPTPLTLRSERRSRGLRAVSYCCLGCGNIGPLGMY